MPTIVPFLGNNDFCRLYYGGVSVAKNPGLLSAKKDSCVRVRTERSNEETATLCRGDTTPVFEPSPSLNCLNRNVENANYQIFSSWDSGQLMTQRRYAPTKMSFVSASVILVLSKELSSKLANLSKIATCYFKYRRVSRKQTVEKYVIYVRATFSSQTQRKFPSFSAVISSLLYDTLGLGYTLSHWR